MVLTDLKVGQSAIVKKINLSDDLTHELISLGFSYGNTVIFERAAPLGDPLQFYVAGNYIAIRKADASKIEVEQE